MKVYFQILFQYLNSQKIMAWTILCTICIQTVVFLSFQVAYKEIFDGLHYHREIAYLMSWIGIVVIASFLRVLFLVLNDYLVGQMSLNIFNQIRLKLYEHLQRLSAAFYQRSDMEGLVSSYSRDLQQSETTTRQVLPLLIANVMSMLFSIIILFYYEWRLAIVVFFLFLLAFLCAFIFMRKTNEITRENQTANAKIASMIDEVATQHLLVQAFNLQDTLLKKFIKILDGYRREFMKGIFFRTLIGRTSIFGLLIAEVIIFCIAILMTYHGLITIGTLFIFFSLVWNISGSVYMLSNYFPSFIESGVNMQRLKELFEEKIEEPIQHEIGGEKKVFTGINENISFQNVSLVYDRRSVIQNVSFEIPIGSVTAFVGSTGSGKTSLLSLILGFYFPTSGQLFFDDMEIRNISSNSLRQQIGVVFQHNPLFNISIGENIRIGKVDATQEEVIEAAKKAEIHDFICSLPDGYHTLIKEFGANLSGGQKQRIALARIFLRNPQILLLDEHTSALDPITENQISKTIAKLAKGRTLIMCTHRLSTLTDIDRIFFLENGHILESGSHDELLQHKGAYYQLWQKQHGIILSEQGKQAEVSISYLRDIFFFENISDDLLKEIAEQLMIEWVDEGTTIFEKGSYGDTFYMIVRGSVEIRNPDAPSRNSLVAILEDGDYFGEIALIKNLPRTATVIASTHCIFLTLNATQFELILKKAPELRQMFEKAVLARLDEKHH